MKTLAIIPARSGSKGITDKNIKHVGGRILLDWSIRQAQNAQLDIIVSTESQEYIDMINAMYPSKNYCPFQRPKSLAKDDTPSNKVILHALDWVEKNSNEKYDTLILLEPTSPLRLTSDITIPIATMRDDESIKSMVSVCASHRAHPALSFRMNRGYLQPNTDIPHLRRQSLDPFYHLTGTIYLSNIEFYREHKTFITPETKGYIIQDWQDFEIDAPDDIIIVECFIKRVM